MAYVSMSRHKAAHSRRESLLLRSVNEKGDNITDSFVAIVKVGYKGGNKKTYKPLSINMNQPDKPMFR